MSGLKKLLYLACFTTAVGSLGILSTVTLVQEASGTAMVAPRMSIAKAQGLCYYCVSKHCVEVGVGVGGYTTCVSDGYSCRASGRRGC